MAAVLCASLLSTGWLSAAGQGLDPKFPLNEFQQEARDSALEYLAHPNEDTFNIFAWSLRRHRSLAPRMVLSTGCAESTVTVNLLTKLVKGHGLAVSGEEYELFVCKKNYACNTTLGVDDIASAMRLLVAHAAARGEVVVFKGEHPHGAGHKVMADLFGSMRAMGTYATVIWRSNVLAHFVCQVRLRAFPSWPLHLPRTAPASHHTCSCHSSTCRRAS